MCKDRRSIALCKEKDSENGFVDRDEEGKQRRSGYRHRQRLYQERIFRLQRRDRGKG